MPYVDLPHTGLSDYASLWYITNSPSGFVSSFDPAKPTILLLHPVYMDTTWLNRQFEDPRLHDNYNMIAFDARHSGRTLARLHSNQDSWTDAADLALGCKQLGLPPAHVWASESPATICALRFAAIFPGMCLSLTLLTVPAEPGDNTSYAMFDELIHMWCYAEEIRTMEHAFINIVSSWSGTDIDNDLLDELIGHLQTRYPPRKRVLITHLASLFLTRVRLSSQLLAAITQPVMLIHGDENEFYSMKAIRQVQSSLVNSRGGAKLYFIKGGQSSLSVIPGTASIANRVFAHFIDRLPHARSELSVPTQESLERQMARSLILLSRLTDDRSVMGKNPLDVMSFSRVRPEDAAKHLKKLKEVAQGQSEAFSPLTSDGRPMRKYSERIHDHWFNEVDKNGMSYVGGVNNDGCETSDCPPLNHSGETGLQQDFEGLRKKANASVLIDPAAFEQVVVKSSFSRVANATGIPLARFLRV